MQTAIKAQGKKTSIRDCIRSIMDDIDHVPFFGRKWALVDLLVIVVMVSTHFIKG